MIVYDGEPITIFIAAAVVLCFYFLICVLEKFYDDINRKKEKQTKKKKEYETFKLLHMIKNPGIKLIKKNYGIQNKFIICELFYKDLEIANILENLDLNELSINFKYANDLNTIVGDAEYVVDEVKNNIEFVKENYEEIYNYEKQNKVKTYQQSVNDLNMAWYEFIECLKNRM